MPLVLKAVVAVVVAALATLTTLTTLSHVHLVPASAHTSAAAPVIGTTELGIVNTSLYSSNQPLPDPTPVPDAAPAGGQDDASSAQPAGTAPAGYVSAPAPRPAPVTIGSAQQSLINADRAAAGLPPLSWSSCLAGIAYGQSQAMAARGAIFHGSGVNQDFGCGLGTSHTGENVGYWSGGINDVQLNTMFMNSPEHRANIMGAYRYVGTAWVRAANGYGYITVEFA